MVTLPLPQPASNLGRLVAGYPSALRPAPGSRIIASGVSSSGTRLQVSLDARTGSSAEAVTGSFRKRLLGRGFVERPAPAVGGSVALRFTRGPNNVTLTVTPGDRTTYIVFATLQAAA